MPAITAFATSLRIRIWIRDERILASKLKQHWLDGVRSRFHHSASCGDTTDQRHHGDTGMRRQGCAQLTATREHVENAGRKYSVKQFCKPYGGEWRLLCRLDDNGIARGKGSCGFGGGKHEGMVECDDSCHDPKRFSHGKVHRVRSHWNGVTFHFSDETREEVPACRCRHDVTSHLLDGIAAV